MFDLGLLAVTINRMWYALPLIVSGSLVYAATRHEQMDLILRHALRTAAWIVGFSLLIFVVLSVITYRL